MNILEDETGFVQYGEESEDTFLDFHMGSAAPSSWIYFPSKEKPSSRFFYTSMEIKMSLDLLTWMRETYSLLDWFGDLGGLFDALWYVVSLLVRPTSAFVLQTTLLTFFRLQKSAESQENKLGD